MKISIISDTHFGDPGCTLVQPGGNGGFVPGAKYEKFREHAGQGNEYLVMVGDIFDFSIASYKEAYNVAQYFFQKIKEDGIAEQIIYVPGNHDADMWHIVEHQTNIIKQVEKGLPPRPFKLAVSGILDVRATKRADRLLLPNVTVRRERGQPPYAGLFLDKITKPEDTYFNFVYPNLYIRDGDETILVTHGHYFSMYWSAGAEWSMILAEDDLKLGSLDIREIVGLNFPLVQLACTGIGQAEPLREVVRNVQREVKKNKLNRLPVYMDRLAKELDKRLKYPLWKAYKEWGSDWLIDYLKKKALKKLAGLVTARDNREFAFQEEVRERIRQYYAACQMELNGILTETGIAIPSPLKVIYGHTHDPISWGDPKAPPVGPLPGTGGKPIRLYNTGGWLDSCSAEIFTYDTGQGFGSVRI